MSKTKKNVLFRLDDMNGAISEVLLQTSIRNKVHKVYVCTKESISLEIENFLNSGEYEKCSKVFIVGSRFEKSLADRIDEIVSEYDVQFIYRDHKEESLDLSKYMWGRVLLFDAKGNPISSSKNLFREVISIENPRYIRLSLLVDMANAAITDYVPVEDEYNKSMIEELYELAGSSEKFAESMIEKILSNDAFFNEADILAKIEAERKAIEEAEEQRRLMQEELRRRRRNTGL